MCGLFISWRKAERGQGWRGEGGGEGVSRGWERKENKYQGGREGAGVLEQQACQGLWSWLAVIYWRDKSKVGFYFEMILLVVLICIFFVLLTRKSNVKLQILTKCEIQFPSLLWGLNKTVRRLFMWISCWIPYSVLYLETKQHPEGKKFIYRCCLSVKILLVLRLHRLRTCFHAADQIISNFIWTKQWFMSSFKHSQLCTW